MIILYTFFYRLNKIISTVGLKTIFQSLCSSGTVNLDCNHASLQSYSYKTADFFTYSRFLSSLRSYYVLFCPLYSRFQFHHMLVSFWIIRYLIHLYVELRSSTPWRISQPQEGWKNQSPYYLRRSVLLETYEYLTYINRKFSSTWIT